MTNQDWIQFLRAIPEQEWGKTVIILSNNSEVCVDTLITFDPNYVVMRGRVGGTIEESRGFVVPYHQIVYVRIERNVKIEEMTAIFGESNTGIAGYVSTNTPKPVAVNSPVIPATPADASRLLLEKMRANRNGNPPKANTSQIN